MLLVPAILENFKSLKDKTLRITFDCNELNPEQVGNISEAIQQFGYLAFKKEPFTQKETEIIKGLKTDYNNSGKTPSQKLRAVFYVNFQQDNKGFTDFESYYEHMMSQVINFYKGKLV